MSEGEIIVRVTECNVMGRPDVRGDARAFPRGWIGPMQADEAGYYIAVGRAEPVEPLSEDAARAVGMLREIVAAFRENRVEPTISDVFRAVASLAAAQEVRT